MRPEFKAKRQMMPRRYQLQMAASALLTAALFFTQLCGVACGFSACMTDGPAPPVEEKETPSCHKHEDTENDVPPAEEKRTGHHCTDHETGVLLTSRDLNSSFDFPDAPVTLPAPFALFGSASQVPAQLFLWDSRKPPPLRIPQQSILRI
jgi:hypothetical protein